jgi:transcriptional regulator with XRE-family HTH domain
MTSASPEWIRHLRTQLGLTQTQLAEKPGVTHGTVSRWESGQARPSRRVLRALRSPLEDARRNRPGHADSVQETPGWYRTKAVSPLTDFRGDPATVRLYVEGERLRYGHLFSPVFGTETALIDPLPHQIMAVYRSMLGQPRLRFLLADDAGAGKTIMAGLYMREMLARRLIRRVLVVPPAGLVGNWQGEMRVLFSLRFREVTGADCRDENPFTGPGSDLAIISIDTLSGGRALARLVESETAPYDLVVFDEAHKLFAFRNADGTYETTERYKLAGLLAGAEPLQETRPPRRLGWHAHHLLLLTATPHMGKDFPYYALWRLLEPAIFRTEEAFHRFPFEGQQRYFLRRVKEEMVRFEGTRLHPTRLSRTVSYDLTPLERELYEQLTDYVRFYDNRARVLNRSAARLAMSVLRRRVASSTWALLRSLERRRDRLDGYIAAIMARAVTEAEFRSQQQRLRLLDIEEERTSDEEGVGDGREEREAVEENALEATTATTLADLQADRTQVLAVALEEATDGRPLPLTANRPAPEAQVLWLRPGEPFFDRYRAYFCERVAEIARRGGAFVDPYASEPYLYHLALLTTRRRADPEFPEAFPDEQVLDVRLAAVIQSLDGEPRQCPVEHLMGLRPAERVPPTAWPAHTLVETALARADRYLREDVLRALAEERRRALTATVLQREAFLRRGFDYQEAELLKLRPRLREQAQAGDQTAMRRLQEVRRRQQELRQREERALAVLRREAELVEAGGVAFLAHAFVTPGARQGRRGGG